MWSASVLTSDQIQNPRIENISYLKEVFLSMLVSLFKTFFPPFNSLTIHIFPHFMVIQNILNLVCKLFMQDLKTKTFAPGSKCLNSFNQKKLKEKLCAFALKAQ